MLTDPCAECGFDGRSLKPPDLVATLKSLPRRWAEILEDTAREDGDELDADSLPSDNEADRSELIHFTPPDGSSAADLAASSAAEIEAAADELGIDGPGNKSDGDASSAALRLVAAVVRWRAEDWSRPDAIDAVRRAAHAGVHNLGPAARVVASAKHRS